MLSEAPRWKLIVFKGSKRIINPELQNKAPFALALFRDPKIGMQKAAELNDRGYKAHIVCRRFPKYPPKGTPEDEEMMWCPYCRRWRYFAVPLHDSTARDLEIKCCKWCNISEEDGAVKDYNGTWNGRTNRRRRKGRKRRKHLLRR